MNKHAYLIMAHNDWDLLSKLLRCLDDERNDIFLHIDKKAAFDPSMIRFPEKAKCTLIQRRSVIWGGYSMVAAEMDLLTAAIKRGGFGYYHLLSGQDLPIKSQDFIHCFFARNSGHNFIYFDPEAEKNQLFQKRMQQYHFLQDVIGREPGPWFSFLRILEKLSLHAQKVLGVNRLVRYPGKMYKGTNWFSITNEMAQYIVSQKEHIEKWFRFSLCADELFLHTLAMQSPFRETIVDNSLRAIDWKRGSPYTYREEDEEVLFNSPKLFARKFSTAVDRVIIEKVMEHVSP